jgi:hypothetical protein
VHWRHGRYSKVFQGIGLGDAYRAARTDPQWVSLREQIASLDTRLIELHARLTGRARVQDWERAAALVHQYKQRFVEGDHAQSAQLLGELAEILNAGATEEETWHEVLSVMESRRRLTETEVKTQERLRQEV